MSTRVVETGDVHRRGRHRRSPRGGLHQGRRAACARSSPRPASSRAWTWRRWPSSARSATPSCSASCSPRRATSRTPSTARASCSSRRSTSATSAATTACTAPSACATRSSSAARSRRRRSATRWSCSSTRATSASCSWPASPTPSRASATCSTPSRPSTRSSAATARSAASTSTWRRSSVPEFKALKGSGIGTYQLFQETYHRGTYAAVHLGGKKKDYDWRVTGMHRAMEAGIDDVGIGVLFGLYDWRFEILALMQHVRELERAFGVGPHTISMPRLEPAIGSDMAERAAAPGERRRLPQDRRHPAPGGALHRHDHEHARDRQPAARDLRPRRQPDLRRQPHQPRRLRGGREVRRGAVPARRPPRPGRGHPRRRRARLRALVLHRLLPARPHRHGLHGPRQARRHQAPLRPQRAGDLPGVPPRLRHRRDPRDRRRAHRAARARDGRRAPRPHRRRCSTRCAPASATCSADDATATNDEEDAP